MIYIINLRYYSNKLFSIKVKLLLIKKKKLLQLWASIQYQINYTFILNYQVLLEKRLNSNIHLDNL